MASFTIVVSTDRHLSLRSLKREYHNVQLPPKKGDLYRIRAGDNVWARIDVVDGPRNKQVMYASVSFVTLALLHHDRDWAPA